VDFFKMNSYFGQELLANLEKKRIAVVVVAGEEHKERDTFIGEGAAALVNNPSTLGEGALGSNCGGCDGDSGRQVRPGVGTWIHAPSTRPKDQ